MKKLELLPHDIASYFLNKALSDGDLITNLKMQKLVYYAYSWFLALNKITLFDEKIEAWANGPVVPSLYRSLSKYKSKPIDEKFIDTQAVDKVNAIGDSYVYTLDSVYKAYMPLGAFELVALTHNELPWKNARNGLDNTAKSSVPLKDEDIIAYFTSL